MINKMNTENNTDIYTPTILVFTYVYFFFLNPLGPFSTEKLRFSQLDLGPSLGLFRVTKTDELSSLAISREQGQQATRRDLRRERKKRTGRSLCV